MNVIELLLLAAGLSMDAFAVSVCKGLSTGRLRPHHFLIIGAWFGGSQALMPTLGWLLGSAFASYIPRFDHWIAFVLLTLIGGNMIREGLSGDQDKVNGSFSFQTMLLLAIATSIDALAVGVTFALTPPSIGIAWSVCLIGLITFLLSGVGLKIGNVFGLKYKNRAVIAGGSILVLIGLKILLEHLGVLSF